MSLLHYRSNKVFKYPPNLQVLDLASLVILYRERGAVKKANPGEFLACSATGKLIKEAKHWFGLNYSQSAWDELLTKNAHGYPLTEVELNILGLIKAPPMFPLPVEFIESHCGVSSQFAYMIIQDLKRFGFLEEQEQGIAITLMGEKALDGISRRLFESNYIPEMLLIAHDEQFKEWYKSGSSGTKKKPTDQTSLF